MIVRVKWGNEIVKNWDGALRILLAEFWET